MRKIRRDSRKHSCNLHWWVHSQSVDILAFTQQQQKNKKNNNNNLTFVFFFYFSLSLKSFWLFSLSLPPNLPCKRCIRLRSSLPLHLILSMADSKTIAAPNLSNSKSLRISHSHHRISHTLTEKSYKNHRTPCTKSLSNYPMLCMNSTACNVGWFWSICSHSLRKCNYYRRTTQYHSRRSCTSLEMRWDRIRRNWPQMIASQGHRSCHDRNITLLRIHTNLKCNGSISTERVWMIHSRWVSMSTWNTPIQ